MNTENKIQIPFTKRPVVINWFMYRVDTLCSLLNVKSTRGRFFWMMNNVININVKKIMMHEMLNKHTHWEDNTHILFQDHIARNVERKQTFSWKRGETSWNIKLRSLKNSRCMKMLNELWLRRLHWKFGSSVRKATDLTPISLKNYESNFRLRSEFLL